MIYLSKKKTAGPMVEAKVWKCSDDVCKGWMRVEFTFHKEPICPHCGSPMAIVNKLVPSMEEGASY